MPNKRLKTMVVIGTRPEAIKLAPVVLAAAGDPRFEPLVVCTSQHREMLDQMIETFGLKVDVDLNIMKPDQTLAHVTTAALQGLHDTIGEHKPDVVIVQGDTTTTFAGALAAFYQRTPVAHVEAGLRTFDKAQPYPEEANRCLTSQVTDFHFPPTEGSAENLRRESVNEDRIWVTGNTSIDALFYTLEKHGRGEGTKREGTRTILLTAHRRENHGEGMESICNAILTLLDRFDDVHVLYPVHMSPRVRKTVNARLGNNPRITLEQPLDYLRFVRAMDAADLVLTDSGGVQEEAPSLGKPVLVLRETTERPEAMQAGTAKLVGTDEKKIVEEASRLLSSEEHYRSMSKAINPYGDGKASARILGTLWEQLGEAAGTKSS